MTSTPEIRRTADACIGTPVSWLRLEQYHAGTLEDAERAHVAAHLAACATCAGCVRRIDEDMAAPLAPLLPKPHEGTTVPAGPVAGHTTFTLRRMAPIVSALAIAAGLVLFLRRAPVPPPDDPTRAKGADVVLSLVREHDGIVSEAGGSYDTGDRFKALVTCPPGMVAAWDLVVFERGVASFPLQEARDVACGNEVALPGAFRLSGDGPMTVCIIWDTDRREVEDLLPEHLPRASCQALEAVP